MNESIETAKKLIDGCSKEEQTALKQYLGTLVPHPLEMDWGIDADAILGAIRRSSDLTKRGVRGIIAEAVFESSVRPSLAGAGWHVAEVPPDLPYDALVLNRTQRIRIQIKLQRLELGTPKLYYPKHYPHGSLFVVEVQKTRSGEITVKREPETMKATGKPAVALTEKTRPYKFGDFDILAVNMHPSCGDWKSFRYTLASWLLPRPSDKHLIEIFQPVAAEPNDVWTNDLATCLRWLESEEQRIVLSELLHVKFKVEKTKRKPKKKAKAKGKRQPVQRKLPEF